MKLSWIAVLVAGACVYTQSCQPGQERFGDSCYQLLTGEWTWEEGSQTCSDMGGSMAVPDSAAEHQFLWNMFTATRSGDLWAGCNEKVEEGHWVQAGKGQDCGYLAWGEGQPSKSSQRCAQMDDKYAGGLLNDEQCHKDAGVTCEFSAVPSITCLREYADDHVAVRCLTSHFIEDFPAKIPLLQDLLSQRHPQWRSFDLRHENRGEKICQLTGTENLDHECLYFNI